MTVRLVPYPMFASPVIVPDQLLLDRLAGDYAATHPAASHEIERFLFGYVPVVVFDRIFAGGAGSDVPGLLWLMHLSGYFGGRWLRGEIVTAQPDAMLASVSIPPSEADFLATVARAQANLAAAAGDDETVLRHARASLFDEPASEEGGMPFPGLTDSFGYNLGYLREILAAPPAGLHAGPEYQIDASGLFGCTYATPRLAVLAELADVQRAVSSAAPPYTELAAELLPLQEAAEPRGRSVWSTGLSVQGFPQREYDQLLDVSSSFLETVQAAALTMLKAVANGDAHAARIGAVANAAMVVWLASYRTGLLDGEGTVELPALRPG